MATHTTPDEFDLMDSRNSFAWNLLCKLRERSADGSLVASSEIMLAKLTDPDDCAVIVWRDSDDLLRLDETEWGVDEQGHWSDCYEASLVRCEQHIDHALAVWYSPQYGQEDYEEEE